MDKKRIIIGLTLGAIIISFLCFMPAGNPLCLIFMLGICGLATWEFFGLLTAGGLTASKRWGTAAGLLFCGATWYHVLKAPHDSTALWAVLLISVMATLYRMLAYPVMRTGLENALGTLLGLMYVPFLWSFFIRIFLVGGGDKPAWTALYLLLCTKLSDSGGYFIGSRFGKTKLSPVISPKKSWEGLGGSVAFCLALNLVWLFFFKGQLGPHTLHLGDALILAFLFPLVGTGGDLVESMFKRAVEVKDSNTMVYGLGGILDMIDSVLFNAPLLYLYLHFFMR